MLLGGHVAPASPPSCKRDPDVLLTEPTPAQREWEMMANDTRTIGADTRP